jgi:hypothetical protein
MSFDELRLPFPTPKESAIDHLEAMRVRVSALIATMSDVDQWALQYWRGVETALKRTINERVQEFMSPYQAIQRTETVH